MLHVLERAIRAGVWAGSLLVIVAYLLSSISEPQSKETALSSQSYSEDPLQARTEHPFGPEEPDSTPVFTFAQWSDRLGTWWFSDLDASSSSYREGEAVPFMLRIDNGAAGATYTITIRFDCAQGARLGYDFLSRYDRDRGTAPALAAGGPGTSAADASLAVPDNPAFTFDDGERDRSFSLWGGYFANAVQEPEPDAACLGDGTGTTQGMYTLTVRALADSVFLLWGGHLASGLDWGEGHGAASARGLLHRQVMSAAADEGGWEGQAGIQAEAIHPPN